jgi:hypothetical protein
MLALTGVATSAFLAMLFSMFESRVSAALSIRESGRLTRNASVTREGRAVAPAYAPSDPIAAILVLKPIIVPFPAAIGVGILFASWLGRMMRTYRRAKFRDAWAQSKNVGTDPALRQNLPVSSQVEKPAEPQHQPQSIPPEQNQIRRAA